MGIFFRYLVSMAGIFLLFAAAIDRAIHLISDILPVVTFAFVIKNLIQDIHYGTVKNNNHILPSVLFAGVDITRVIIFFRIVRHAIDYYVFSCGGMNFFLAVIKFLFIFIMAGVLFLFAEVFALYNARADRKIVFLFVHIIMIFFLMQLSLWAYNII